MGSMFPTASPPPVEYPLNESSLDRAAGRFQYLYDKYLNGSNRVFLSVIPDKDCFLAGRAGTSPWIMRNWSP